MGLTIEEALKRGVEAHKAGQVQEADRFYTAILQAEPKHPDANHNMGVIGVGVGKIQEALPYFKVALEAGPRITQFWLSYIDALIRLDAINEARNMLAQAKEKGIESEAFIVSEQRINQLSDRVGSDNNTSTQSEVNILDTKSLNQALGLAKRKLKEGSIDEARRIYQNIIGKFPKNTAAIQGIKALPQGTSAGVKGQEPEQGQLQPLIDLYSKGELQQVEAQASQMLRQFPQSFVLHNLLGAVNAGLEHHDAAIDSYRKALRINPSFAEAHNNLGVALKKRGDLEGAITNYKQAIEINPNYAAAFSNMGTALQENGDPEGAIDSYKQTLKINPGYAGAHFNIGVSLQSNGDLEAAIASYKQALKTNPCDIGAYNNMGGTLNELGRLEEAESIYRKAISLEPDFAEAHNNLGSVLRKLGKLDEAISSYTQASYIEPDNPKYYPLRGYTPSLFTRQALINEEALTGSISKGDWEESKAFLEEACEENIIHIEGHFNEFIELWCQSCHWLINQGDVQMFVPIFIKLLLVGERNRHLDNLIKCLYESFDIDTILELVNPQDEILVKVSYCQYNFANEDFSRAEALAALNIQDAASLIEHPETEDLGWLVVRRSMALCKHRDFARRTLNDLISNLAN